MFLLLAACVPSPEVRVSHIDSATGTVAAVEWDSVEAVEGWVDAGEGNVTPAVSATHHRHVVWGLPPDTTVPLSVFEEGEVIAELSVRTDPPPAELPEVTLEAGGWDGVVAVPYSTLDDDRSGVVVVDGAGRRVAWMPASPLVTSVAWDGPSFWHNVTSDSSELRHVWLDGSEPESLPVPGAHHEFVVGEQSAYLRTTERDVDGETIFGDQLVTFDGSVIWDSFDTLPIERHEAWDALPGGADWTHANGLARDEARGTWIVSLYWLREVLEIDDDGAIVRSLRGDVGEPFGPQHAAEPVGDHVLLFDNQLLNGHSRVIELGWDGVSAWEWAPDPPVQTLVLGDVDRLSDGRTLTAWGTDGAVIGLGADGEEAWRIRLEEGFVVGQPAWRSSLYAE